MRSLLEFLARSLVGGSAVAFGYVLGEDDALLSDQRMTWMAAQRHQVSDSIPDAATRIPRRERSELSARLNDRLGHDRSKLAAGEQMVDALMDIFDGDHPPKETLAKISRAVACRALTFAPIEGREMGLWIESLVVNSVDRSEKYLQWNDQWKGSLMALPELKREVVCDSY